MTDRNRARRRMLLALPLTAALLLTGCGAMPNSSDVFAGAGGQDEAPPSYTQLPGDPAVGASPQAIVDGFIGAATSPAGDYEIARKYLADPASWQPRAGTTVDIEAERELVADPDPLAPAVEPTPASTATPGTATADPAPVQTGPILETTVSVTVIPLATIDPQGIYAQADPAPIVRTYTLGRQADGEWRITDAPDGVLMEQTQFSQAYGSYEVMFFDQTYTFLVPDLRWFPRGLAPNRITAALVEGQSETLKPATVNAFPEGTLLREPSTTIDASGEATVAFAELPNPDATALGRIQLQLRQSLQGISSVRDLQMTIGTTPVSVTEAISQSTSVGTGSYIIRDGELGVLAGTEFTAIDGFDWLREQSLESFASRSGSDRIVARISDGTVVAGRRDGGSRLLDSRDRLIAPAIDPWGYVWSAPSDDPAALQVINEFGGVQPLSQSLQGLTSVTAIEVSRDGTRLAVFGTSSKQAVLASVPIVRDATGRPTALGTPTELETPAGAPIDVAWLDDLTVGALVRTDDATGFISRQIGGVSEHLPAPAGAVAIAGANASSGVRVLTDEGVLYTRNGAQQWQASGTGIAVLGTRQVNAQQ